VREKVVQQVKQTSLSIVQNSISAIRRKNIQKTGCRVISGNKIGVAGGLGMVSDNELFARAENSLEYGVEYPVALSSEQQLHDRLDNLAISDGQICEAVERVLGELKRRHPDFAVSNKVNYNNVSFSLENEANLSLSHNDSYISWSFALKSSTSTGIMDTFFGVVDRKLEPDRVIEATSAIIEAYNNKVELPAGQVPVIIHQSALTRLFQRDLNGKIVGNKASLLQQKFDQKVFCDNFSVKIENDPVETFGPRFDMEGAICADDLRWLIKNGVILRPYTDKRTAQRYGFAHTACGNGAYDGVPSLGGCNMEIEHSGKTLSELLSDGVGILIAIAAGGDFTPDGNFATPVQVAYLTDGVKLLGRLPELTIKGSLFDFFGNDFIGVSSDKIYLSGNDRMLVTRLAVEKL
jgi:PmbA protein